MSADSTFLMRPEDEFYGIKHRDVISFEVGRLPAVVVRLILAYYFPTYEHRNWRMLVYVDTGLDHAFWVCGAWRLHLHRLSSTEFVPESLKRMDDPMPEAVGIGEELFRKLEQGNFEARRWSRSGGSQELHVGVMWIYFGDKGMNVAICLRTDSGVQEVWLGVRLTDEQIQVVSD